MTKEITKSIILQEMQNKLKLRDLLPERFIFLEAVTPIYNIEQHLKTRVCTHKEISITSASSFLFFTIPDNERWFFDRYDVVFMGAGAYTVAGVYLLRCGQTSLYLDLTAGQSASYHTALPVPVVGDPGDSIHVNVDGYTSTQNLRLYLDYTVEELR